MRRRLLAVVAVAAAVGATGGGLRYVVRGLLHRRAEAARRVIGKPLGEVAPDADRVWKPSHGNPVDLLLLGDSIAAGLGADLRKEQAHGHGAAALRPGGARRAGGAAVRASGARPGGPVIDHRRTVGPAT